MPTEQEIATIALYIQDAWKRLGRALGIKEVFIDIIQEEEKDAYERAYKMLIKWRDKMGSEASYEALAQALKHKVVGRSDLIRRFCYKVENEGI